MRKARLTLGFAVALGIAGLAGDAAPQDDWRAYAWQCLEQGGQVSATYFTMCQSYDQYDSLLACQQLAGNEPALQSLRAAGRETVDGFMASLAPPSCK